jgi:hypothetical protein
MSKLDKYLSGQGMGSPQKGAINMPVTDDILDLIEAELEDVGEEPNSLRNIPTQNPDKMSKRLEDDIVGDSGELDEDSDEEEDYANQYDEKGVVDEMVDRTVLEQDTAYQTYFRGVMKKHGATDIKHMSPDKKRVFFKDVSNGWKSRKKVKESKENTIISEDYKEYFKSMMKKHDIKNISDLEGDKKKEFFKKVNAGWKSKEEMKEDVLVYEQYKKYFTYMLDQCGIEDFGTLTETEQAEFMSLVNEAFQTMNELMQKPGAPITNPMSGYGNMIDKMKNQVRPERRVKQMAAAKQVRRPEVRT